MSTGKTVLIVEDSDFERKLLQSYLAARNVNVVEVSSGEACLEQIETKRPDLVLLDVKLRGISGFNVLIEIRKKLSLIDLPVIVVSASTDAALIVEAIELGANDYITKPFFMPIVSARVATHLKIVELTQAAVSAAAAGKSRT